MDKTTFSVYEAARELVCSSQWIRVLLAEGRLAGAAKIEGHWQIPVAAIEQVRRRRELLHELRREAVTA